MVLESLRKVLAKWLQFFCEPWIILVLLISVYELYWGNKLTKLVCGPSKYQERYFHVFINLFLVCLLPLWFFFWQLNTSFYIQRKCLRWSQCLFFIFCIQNWSPQSPNKKKKIRPKGRSWHVFENPLRKICNSLIPLSRTFQNPIHSIFPTLLNIENTRSCNSACNVPAMAMLSSRHICLVVVVVVCCLIQTSLRAMASDSSVHSAAVNEVHLVPIDIIIRPIPPVLEEAKVNSLIKTIQVGSNDSNVERLYGIMITIHAS